MAKWPTEELTRIGRAEEVRIASLRRDGTRRKPVTTWVVPSGESLYVRSVKGHEGAWFRGVQETHEGRISASGLDREVTFVNADHEIDDEVDAAYRTKYRRYAGSILNSVLTPQARSATLKIEPRSE
jgi:hypothetical protein